MSSDSVTFFTFNAGLIGEQDISLTMPSHTLAADMDAVIGGLAKLLANEFCVSVGVSGDYVLTPFWISPD
jgi:hypothetical protein